MAKRGEPKTEKAPELNRWDARPLPAKGDDSDATTFEAVGRALSAWEAFELDLSRIFGALIGQHKGLLVAMRAYGSVLAFRGRAEMVRIAAETFFLLRSHEEFAKVPDEQFRKELMRLIKLAIKYSPRRNEIAHGIVLRYEQFLSVDHKGFCLGPPAYSTNKQELLSMAEGQLILNFPSYCYSSSEINVFRERFLADLAVPARELVSRIFQRHLASR